ncbi:MAG: TCR/Tet family MFS transporter [Gammaproteobacteria bacterium]|jgi:DHA1 family tetracycline resistance protein-like MFS transporter|nr:TCR/Tet family MFS transporter [Gammaproteobacteria bacterium]MBT3859047.1 TCR/Tet family MFS transporter [Gammaproteobacteria bacterium]MBT3987842.1 TCR/Tet family MFS transporter [Gammaproteobacteria bacterium]MBT4254449.1 TCR/Tet family MFS transporter [Gammaproteobacteria bacterium]MBT4581511.1 TCR/Tet family MFS transporter [Gammaproteobacteria bacterium]
MPVDISSHKHALGFIIAVVFIDSIGFGIILPVMPSLIMGLSDTSLSGASRIGGYLMFTYAAVQFFAAPILGNLGDKFGRRPVLLYSLAALSIASLFMAVAPTLFWLFIARMIAGIASSTFSLAYAYVTDITPEEKRAQRFGMIGAAFGGGFIFGPVIGGVMGEYGPRIPFYAAAALAFINLVYGYFALGESLSEEHRRPFDLKRANPVGALLQMRKYPVILGLGLAYFLYMLGHFSLPSTFTYYTMEKFAWSESQIGFALGYAGVFMILVQAFLIRWAVPRFGSFKSGVFGLVTLVIGFSGYAFATEGWQMYPWLAVASISGFVTPAFQSIMTSQIPANAQGELQGALSSLNSITSIVGPLIMTQLFAVFTADSAPIYFPGSPFLAAAILTVICLLIFIPVVKHFRLTELGRT